MHLLSKDVPAAYTGRAQKAAEKFGNSSSTMLTLLVCCDMVCSSVDLLQRRVWTHCNNATCLYQPTLVTQLRKFHAQQLSSQGQHSMIAIRTLMTS
eukprot:6340569-Amphidinium_carterae.1